ncbi:ATP-binding protein [Thalassospira lucentensis]|uniref:ATP-binding protein n=1 Tax=Thalassospira lucentensis TaxID=168935 RepID=UPI003D2ED56C
MLFVSLLLIGLACIGLTTFYESTLNREVREETDRALSRLAGHGRTILLNDIGQYRDNLYFLHATPPISGITRAAANDGIDPFDGTRFVQWKNRLETIFVSMLQNNQEIDQLRVIQTNDTGTELIRVDRLSGKIDVIEDQWLQEKSASDYYQASADLHPGELYLSRINLNREFGRIEYPIRPTIRLATPIFYDDGSRFGFLIMNVNASVLLDRFRSETEGQFDMFLTDNDGYYIDHPKASYRFSRDLTPEHNWLSDYSVPESEDAIATNTATKQTFVFHHVTAQYAADPSSTMHIYAAAPSDWVANHLWNRRLATYGFTSFVLLILLSTLAVFMRSYRNSVRLSAARAEYEAIINGSSDAVIGLELQGRITTCNDAAVSLLHRSRNDAIGQNISDIGQFSSLDFMQKIDKVRETKSSLSMETTLSESDNKEVDLAVTFSPIILENKELAGIAVIVRDITQEKSAERQILQANAKLEAEVAKRTEELAKAHKKAMHASDMKSTFISHVSHEMRTPLNGISGSLNLIRHDPLSDNQQKYLAMAETSSSTLATLINDILDLSKIEAGKLDFEHRAFNPIVLFETVAQSSSIRAQEKKIDLILDTTKLRHDRLYGDANRLKQVLNNLISNAMKFTSNGYVAISAESQIEGDQIRLDVRIEDSGIGIAKKNKHKLFSAFSQEDSSVSANFGGTGLGLSISKQLCNLMNGDISFESEKGVGSTFFFHLCFDMKDASLREQSHALSDMKVLILMDQAKARDFAANIVHSLGGEVTDQSVDDIGKNSDIPAPDMIITDRINGRLTKLCAQIEKNNPTDQTLPALCVIKALDQTKPAYKGKVCVVTSPLTQTSLATRTSNLTQMTETQSPTHPIDIATTSKPSDKSGSSPKLDQINILIVDDNDINLAVAQGLLTVTKANTQTAHNGIEAIETLRQTSDAGNHYHCILMDCQMPGMDGYETTNAIRSGKVALEISDIPIIAMTASAMSGEREKCLAAGMSDYITKPIQADILIERVTHWVQIRQDQLADG